MTQLYRLRLNWFRCLTFTLLGLLCGVQTAVSAEPDASRQKLIELIRDVGSDIEEQRQKLKDIKKRSDQRISSIEQQRKTSAQELIDLRRTNKQLQQRIELERSRKEQLQQTVNELKEDVDQARNLFPLLRSIIEQHIQETPPSGHRSMQKSRLRQAKTLMNENGKPVAALQTCTGILISLLRERRGAERITTSIRTPDGQKRKVELLRAGSSFVAYRTLDGNNHGIRVDGTNGYRWQTDLPSDQKQRINRALETVSSTDASGGFSLTLPLDPTQEMSRTLEGTATTLYERLMAGGPVMVPLALIAVIALLLILERFWTLRREHTRVNHLLEQVQSALQEGHFDRAQSICRKTPGAVPAVLDTLINARDEDPETTQDRVEEEILRQMPRLERFLPSLNVLAGVAPLLGLLGTVTGIIETFDVISVFGAGNQELMAGGISEALMTTATGLAIAIPVLLCHGYFRSRVDTIIGNMERTAATVYNFLQSEGEPLSADTDDEQLS